MKFKVEEEDDVKSYWEPIFEKEIEGVKQAAERALYPRDIISMYPGEEEDVRRPASLKQVIEQKQNKNKFYDNIVGNDWKSKNKRNYLKGKK